MKYGKDNNSCLFVEDLVSYIYGELSVTGRTAFEDHLLNCGDCIEEFAAVSESRLGVYEWHRDEFLPLETPVFEIPFRRPVEVAEPAYGWFDAVRELFTPARLAVAGGAFAVLAFALGTGFVVSTPTAQLVADANENVKPPAASFMRETVISKTNGTEQTEPDVSSLNESKAEHTNVKPPQPASRPVKAKLTNINAVKQNQIQAARSTSVPRLGTYDEAEDTSLRLADLVADIDTNDF